VRDPAPVAGALDGDGGQLGVVAARLHGGGGDRDVLEDGREVEVLERATAADLGRHLAGDRDHGRLVQLRVVQTGQQVGRARPRDREARGRSPGELP
jgi:hypothetical protein